MNDVIAPLILAATGLPALFIAAWSGRGGSAHARGTGLRWALIALCAFIAAIALYFFGGHRGAAMAIGIGFAVAANVLVVSMVLHLRRGDTGAARK
ncbi:MULTISPECIES: hypothetical protein [Stenotrophomonas]|uniref:Membrane protein n=1 Tax=Stenotrophomonas nitritireducens TaxID=83617 RepID=A0ABR5NN50_9GAMM|nr:MULTISPECIES: hypothetical protein [Stenotrophomonas]KQO02233.1 hypothetical protein ASF01_00405 [Stenotrophomonas sp. Leaf70]KRG59971.1 membrane protein [Stenotrophomonas nitritireducens]